MSATHTPGPWAIQKGSAHPWVVECATTIPGILGAVCKVDYQPNAALIAAAPDMLAALRMVVVDMVDDGWCPPADDARMVAIQAAIAKATGGLA